MKTTINRLNSLERRRKKLENRATKAGKTAKKFTNWQIKRIMTSTQNDADFQEMLQGI
jgi:hypothetical protein